MRWRERVLVASPQVLVHALNSDHGETTQSTGQAWMLQKPLVSVVTPQLAPPNLAGLIMERERVWRPPPVLPLTSMFMLPPHVTEHAPYEPQADIVQSTGHAAALQLRDSSRLGHTKPPCAARSMTERERTWVPPPQVLVHAVQRDQPPIWQWIGHGVLLQLSTSTFLVGHATPPIWAATLVRVRVLMPPVGPQETEHLEKVVQAPTTQSTGQASTLQDCTCSPESQVLPPKALCTAIGRVRLSRPCTPACASVETPLAKWRTTSLPPWSNHWLEPFSYQQVKAGVSAAAPGARMLEASSSSRAPGAPGVACRRRWPGWRCGSGWWHRCRTPWCSESWLLKAAAWWIRAPRRRG